MSLITKLNIVQCKFPIKSMKQFFFFLFFTSFILQYKSQISYIIGDSQSFVIGTKSKNAELYKPLCKSGIGVQQLNVMLQNYEGNPNVENVFVTIGVNDNYYDKGLGRLVNNLESKFPNAYVFFVKGSYGWGNVNSINAQSTRFKNYYTTIRKYGIYVLDQSIGYGDPHHDKWEYREIGDFIDYIIYFNWKRQQNQK